MIKAQLLSPKERLVQRIGHYEYYLYKLRRNQLQKFGSYLHEIPKDDK